MTATEIKIAKAIAYDCRYYQPSNESNFIIDMASKADDGCTIPLTVKQRQWLFAILHKYRKQIPDFHREHCTNTKCRIKMKNEEKKKRTQLALF